MRTPSLLVLGLVGLLAGSLRADVPVPHPTRFSLTGLSHAAGYQFSYITENDEKSSKSKLLPIKDGEVYTVEFNVKLYVGDGKGVPQNFASLKHLYRGNRYTVDIQGVKSSGGKLEVEHKVTSEPAPILRRVLPPGPVPPPPPAKKGAASSEEHPAGYFALALVSLGALVWRWPRREQSVEK